MTETQTTQKRSGPAWQNDPERKAAAVKKAQETRAANKRKQEERDAAKAARKAARQPTAPTQRMSVTVPVSNDVLEHYKRELTGKIEALDSDITELSQTLESAESAALEAQSAALEARTGLQAATKERDRLAAGITALETVT